MSRTNRREFLKTAGAGTLGMMVTGPMIKSGLAKDSPNERINVAVMGIRGRGAEHAEFFAGIPGVEVSVLCDIDERILPKAVADLEKVSGKRARTETDIRRVLEDKDVDVLAIASPNHWHSLAAIWACQAGKDVYVEKPVSHNIFEGRKMVEAARKYQRIVQTGSQSRSTRIAQAAMDYIHSGKLGEIYMAKCVISRPRESFGRGKISSVPQGVHYDLWLGPAQWRPFNENRFHYNWHWFWDTGNGETGNNGPHYTDLARWALRKYEHPRRIQSMGGYFAFDCEQETPNTQHACMEYADGKIVQLEVRGLYTNLDTDFKMGMLFFGSEGWMKLEGEGESWATFYGRKNEPGPAMSAGNDSQRPDAMKIRGSGGGSHFENFIAAVRSRNRSDLNADILEGHLSASMCHLCNIAYRTGRTVVFDSDSESFIGDDEADSMVSREYRYPYIVPENV
ncbi:MAG: Gfo/Idh/MocA family oxidoreductase [Gemmatimonadota bacterium]|nr:Gfo/Idh/MocA family oxidoreductase [Gemmatimonadota bacterium]